MKIANDSAQVRFPPPFIYAGMLLAGLVVDRAAGLALALPLGVRLAGVALFAGGGGLMMVAAGLFRKRGTPVPPWQSVSLLVQDGPYRFTRNPMYLGMALAYLGLAALLSSGGALLLLPAVILLVQTQVIAREERYLTAKFGEAYLAYRRHVRRWL
jgi:protein-S-isoprenylcysteine O-methyltransferase Ste14